ncbi:MAG: hypothetical protein M1814_002401 [Vezdaea aestivalis]|nr:MAG: hypothetical protein M1814_002401 [Vezdaea aestivalis]
MLSHDDRPARGYSNFHGSRAGMMPNHSIKPRQQQRHVWVVTGPAGCGKTTVAKYLQKHLKIPYIEGDEYHPTTNVEKMAAGTPLTDADRWDWLEALRYKAAEEVCDSNASGVILTCSALKSKYRDVIRVISYFHSDVTVRFLYLRGDEEILLQRVKQRAGHYMKEGMVHSQFTSLEEPEPTRETDVLIVDVGAPEAVVKENALAAVKEALRRDLSS